MPPNGNNNGGGGNVNAWVRPRGDTEITSVSKATEVGIPWLTYRAHSLLYCCGVLVGWLVGWLLWARANAKAIGYWRWVTVKWWPWASLNWPWVVISLLVVWVGPPAWNYGRRLHREQRYKREPQYGIWPAEYGEWDPRGYAEDEDEPEPERDDLPLENVDLTHQPETSNHPQTVRVQGLLASPDARRFYRWVVDHDGEDFTERKAADCGIDVPTFRVHIRDVLLNRGLATWKNERYHNQGVDLTDAGLGLLAARAYHSPTRPAA